MYYILLTNDNKKYLIRPEAYRYFFEVRGYKVDAIGYKDFLEALKQELKELK